VRIFSFSVLTTTTCKAYSYCVNSTHLISSRQPARQVNHQWRNHGKFWRRGGANTLPPLFLMATSWACSKTVKTFGQLIAANLQNWKVYFQPTRMKQSSQVPNFPCLNFNKMVFGGELSIVMLPPANVSVTLTFDPSPWKPHQFDSRLQ